MLDPYQVIELVPPPAISSPPASTVAPIPTVIPTPSITWQEAGKVGEQTLWVTTVLLAVFALLLLYLTLRLPLSKRLLPTLSTLLTILSFLVYYVLSVGDGIIYHTSCVKEHHSHDIPPTYETIEREVYWARYVDWALTFPLLVVSLSLLAGLNGATIFASVCSTLVFVLFGLFAVISPGNDAHNWGYYTIACLAYLLLLYHVLLNGRSLAIARGSQVGKFYVALGSYSFLVWIFYPIIWALGPLSRHLSVNGEILVYAILDLLAKPVFGFWLITAQSKIEEAAVTVDGFWTNGLAREGTIRVGDEEEGA